MFLSLYSIHEAGIGDFRRVKGEAVNKRVNPVGVDEVCLCDFTGVVGEHLITAMSI